MRRIVFSRHAKQQMLERGATETEVIEAITGGERVPAKHGRMAFRRNFEYGRTWGTKTYRLKQVMPIVREEPRGIIVITVYTFYF